MPTNNTPMNDTQIEMIQAGDDDRCIYCGRAATHPCAGSPICDFCCQIKDDVIVAVPLAEEWLKRGLDYHVHGLAMPEPPEYPWTTPERGSYHALLARRVRRRRKTLRHATEVFGHRYDEKHWLKTANMAFAGWSPGHVSTTRKGFVLVRELLNLIDENRRTALARFP